MSKANLAPKPPGALGDHLPLGVAISSIATGEFLEVNEAFTRMLQLSRKEALATTDVALGIWPSPEHREQFVQQAKKSKTRSQPISCEIHPAEGVPGILQGYAQVIDTDKGHIHYLLLDLTQTWQEQSRVNETQKLEAIGQLAAGFAHDFNNILAIIQGYTSLVLAEPGLERQSHKALRQVSTAAERGATLTRQLMIFSRKQIMHPKVLDLNLVLQGAADVVQRLAGERIKVKVNYMGEPGLIKADNAMLEQVLMNLALNARDAMPQGGSLVLALSHEEAVAPAAEPRQKGVPGKYVCLSVTDDGCGMPNNMLTRIFEPFFTTKNSKSAGLGLATVYGIVKQHNGWLDVKSKVGKGTTFKIFIPAHVPREEGTAPPTNNASQKKEKILVVEDETGVQTMVQGILERYGYKVLSAANGTEALEVWNKNRGLIDLLLTDMVMPEGMTGRQLAHELQAQKPGLKVIYTSGYTLDVMAEEADELVEGVNFLQKPYRPQHLAQTVRSCLDASIPGAHTTLLN